MDDGGEMVRKWLWRECSGNCMYLLGPFNLTLFTVSMKGIVLNFGLSYTPLTLPQAEDTL